MSGRSYSRPRHYLSGIDWFVRTLDWRTRASTGTGSYSQVALVLRGRLDAAALRARLRSLLTLNPVLAGRCRRDLRNLAPYWSVRLTSPVDELPLEMLTAKPEADAPLPPELVDAVNHPLPGRWRVAFTLAQTEDRSYLAMRFDHQILDAGGAERLLRTLASDADRDTPLPVSERPAHLDQWKAKFRSGQVTNRTLLALRGSAPPVAFPLPSRQKHIHSRFVFREISPSRTKRIMEQANRKVGYLMLLPFLLSETLSAFHSRCVDAGLPGSHYVIPVTMDARRSGDADAIFFNHLSFHFYRFDAVTAADPASLRQQAAAQFYRQTRDHVADHVAQAGYLMRILPVPLLGRLMELPLSGRLGSFSFALLANDALAAETFMGIPIESVYHMPRVPAPPGIGVFFTRHQCGLNLVLSYLDNMLGAAEAETLADAIGARLELEA